MELTLAIDNTAKRTLLFGPADSHLRLIRSALDVKITARESTIKLSGPNESIRKAASVLDSLQARLRKGDSVGEEDVNAAIAALDHDGSPVSGKRIAVYHSNTSIIAKTDGQARYIEAIDKYDLTFCLGPAGSGKTYLAVAMCVALLKERRIRRLVLVRPAVEAGEKLGYLPGDMQAKVNPYLRPLFDAMHDMMSYDQIKRFMENDVIEVVPLAFMRGRTLNHSAVILDEAQNATPSQMLMFLTRLGQSSKMIVTGDASQTDLPSGQANGVVDAVKRLKGIKNIGVVELEKTDIVRHRLVQNIVKAYESKKATSQR
ncbi:MAG: phosphate starvation protein PhoH [Phycisphaerae bacterium]|nr:MAG: phosphate starvation protein PhoH [Phycisphaerae bacterium]